VATIIVGDNVSRALLSIGINCEVTHGINIGGGTAPDAIKIVCGDAVHGPPGSGRCVPELQGYAVKFVVDGWFEDNEV
jgi:L-ascorbate metabolism protein UlaG (beta-lactamase superfamily)